jgi:cell division protein FtsI/penicillin-binding protein 2
LALAAKKYEFKAGEITVLDPKTGAILGSATWPTYDPDRFFEYSPELYKNPIVSNLYEPGSTFKVLTVAAGIDAGKVTPDTLCPRCAGPRKIDKYEIKTWNEEYHPDISMKDALAKSDNIAMVYVAESLGGDVFEQYLRDFGIGTTTTSDLQEDSGTVFPQKWGPVELATRSFGQGITVTSLQLLRAIASIANQGKLMQPQLVKNVYDPVTSRTIETEPVMIRQVVKPETAREVTQMMVYAAEKGEAQWTKRTDLRVAGKTGTAQIASQGGYDAERTIASFIGFAPAEDPHFVMLVKLVEPGSSPWAAETAAPLWYKTAEQLFLLLNIPVGS